MKYFFGEAAGLKADIERHRKTQAELEAKVAEAEGNPDREFADVYIRTYRHFLCQLLQSKAEVVSKIGRNKRR